MNVYFHTFGCKVNSFESAAMANILKEHGYTVVESELDADIVVVNSCTVTANTDRKVRQYLHKIKRDNEKVITVLTGCFVEAFPDEAAKTDGADIVTGNASRKEIYRVIDEYLKKSEKLISIEEASREFESLFAPELEGHTRAFMKIEDGCERYCSYCIIPFARGRVRSMTLAEIERQAKVLAENGYREIVVSGINLSFYGKDIGCNLADAIETIASVDGIERIRLGSLEPDLLDGFIERLSKVKKLCSQFHLALQSGCDATLKRMNRHYTAMEYCAVADRIRSLFENPTFTTDVIVGFPGETQEDFEQSLDFIKGFGFLKVHIFPYSVRPGTVAAKLPDQIQKAEKERRAKLLFEAVEPSRDEIIRSFIGSDVRVILEAPDSDGLFTGYTDRYAPVLFKSKNHEHKTGDIVVGSPQKIFKKNLFIEL